MASSGCHEICFDARSPAHAESSASPVWSFAANACFQSPHARLSLRNLLQLLLRVDPRLGFVRIVQERKHPVVFVVRQRIKFVSMALSTLCRHPQHCFADAVDAVEHLDHAKLLRHDRAFFVDHAVAQKSCGDDLFLRRIGQKISGNLLDKKLVVGHVEIDGFNHPVAP